VARIFGDDPTFHERIVQSADASEVYDLLQSREIREINYFLEDE